MQVQLTSLTNPRWATAEHNTIDCEITTSKFGNEVLPFTANQKDCELFGRQIFEDIVAGIYGDIADYVPLPLIEVTVTPSSGTIPTEVL